MAGNTYFYQDYCRNYILLLIAAGEKTIFTIDWLSVYDKENQKSLGKLRSPFNKYTHNHEVIGPRLGHEIQIL
jgi:hypothetical protein